MTENLPPNREADIALLMQLPEEAYQRLIAIAIGMMQGAEQAAASQKKQE